jgi:hypothetical protein
MAKLDGKQIEGRELRVTLAQRPRPEYAPSPSHMSPMQG